MQGRKARLASWFPIQWRHRDGPESIVARFAGLLGFLARLRTSTDSCCLFWLCCLMFVFALCLLSCGCCFVAHVQGQSSEAAAAEAARGRASPGCPRPGRPRGGRRAASRVPGSTHPPTPMHLPAPGSPPPSPSLAASLRKPAATT